LKRALEDFKLFDAQVRQVEASSGLHGHTIIRSTAWSASERGRLPAGA